MIYLVLSSLKKSLQKNNLSSSKLVFIQFGYRGFSFLSHAVRLWFMVFSKLALVSLDCLYNSFPTGLKESLKRVKTC